jgi:hypothetical protein
MVVKGDAVRKKVEVFALPRDVLPRDMFAPEVPVPSILVKINTAPSKAPFAPLAMGNCFFKNAARADAMLILRMLANQNAKAENVDEFFKQINREIAIKSGDLDAETVARDALICKFIK